MMTVEQLILLLASGCDRAEVFPFGDKNDEPLYRRLRSLLHPDHCANPNAAAYFHALEELWTGKPNPFAIQKRFVYLLAGGSHLSIRPQAMARCAIGTRIVTEHGVAYVHEFTNTKLVDPYYTAKRTWPFANDAMKVQCLTGPDGFLPQVVDVYTGRDESVLVKVVKSSASVPLDLLLNHCGGQMEPQAVAWILSGLYNAACYLEYAGIVHLGMDLSAIFVEPANHRTTLPGGWGHAVGVGKPPRPVPHWVANALPRGVRGATVASHVMVHELIRAIGRTLLGDSTGFRYAHEKQTPMIRHLLAKAEGTAIEQYKAWRKATAETFGGHHFHKMAETITADPAIVYGGKDHG